MSIGNRLREKREAAGLTLEHVAKQIGVSRQTLSRYETGVIQGIPLDKIEALADELETTPAYLMGWEENGAHDNIIDLVKNRNSILPIEKKSIPLLGRIACGVPKFAEQDFGSYVYAGSDLHVDFALRADGDSMIGARIYDGDIVFIRQQDYVDNGEIAAVIIDDEATLKRVYQLSDGRVELRAENPKVAPIILGGEGETRSMHILGKAVAFQGDIV